MQERKSCRCLQRHHTVAGESQSVHPIGQPIRASTNRGLSCREVLEIAPPSCLIIRPRRPRESPVVAASVRLTPNLALLPALFRLPDDFESP